MKLRAVLLAASLFSPHAWAGGPDQCTDLSAVAPFTQIRYEQIQNVFSTDSGGTLLCLGCHPGNIGAGNLGLASEFSYGNLVGVPSDGVPGCRVYRREIRSTACCSSSSIATTRPAWVTACR